MQDVGIKRNRKVARRFQSFSRREASVEFLGQCQPIGNWLASIRWPRARATF